MTSSASDQAQSEKPVSPPPAQPPARQSIIDRMRSAKLRAGASALGGMVLGTLVGLAVNKAVATTGILGPGVATLMEDQRENFAAVNERLESLRASATGPEAQRAIAELGALLQKQSALAQQSEQQLRLLTEENAASRERELAAGERACKILYKQATPREDARVGFDLVCE